MPRRDVQMALRVLRRIQQHSIKDPITGAVLAEEFGIPLRSITQIVEELRYAGHKIGSNKEVPFGYFLAKDALEMYPTTVHMESMAKKILVAVRRLRDWGGDQPTVFEQVPEDLPA